jgi:hypothetical protein
MCVPLDKFCSFPPNNISNIAFLIISCPYIEGAKDRESNPKIFSFLAIFPMFAMSASVITLSPISPERMVILFAIITVLFK